MSERIKYLKALDGLQKAHTSIHRSLCAFKEDSSDEAVLAQMLEAYSYLQKSLEAMGYKP